MLPAFKTRLEEQALWGIDSIEPFMPPPPPGDWKKELKKTWKIQRSLTKKEIAAAHTWCYIAKPRTQNWITLTNTYMEENCVGFGKVLQVRGVLMMALYDSLIISGKAKQLYNEKRPFEMDTGICPSIPRPRSPSYPSGHAALAGAGAEVLGFYFPQNCKEWKKLARESAFSRVWGGVHFPIDVQEGLIIGREVGKEILKETSI